MCRKRALVWMLASCLLCGCGTQPQAQSPTFVQEVVEKVTATDALTFPLEMESSTLIAEEIVCYQGAFWEDGSGEQVENVAGLMLYNPTDRLVEFAAFAFKQKNRTLYFFVHHLPPKSRCLVLEKYRQEGSAEQITQCRELNVRWSYQELSREQVDYVGLGPLMTIVNRDGRTINHITVRYKQYVKEGDYYLGGVAYSAHLFFLQPEERRTIQPEHYKAGYARIVGIELKE